MILQARAFWKQHLIISTADDCMGRFCCSWSSAMTQQAHVSLLSMSHACSALLDQTDDTSAGMHYRSSGCKEPYACM